MDFAYSGVVAGLSAAVLASGWYAVKRSGAIPSPVAARKTLTLHKILQDRLSSVAVTDPGLQILPSEGTNVLDRKTAATRAELKEQFLKMETERNRAASDRDRLTEQLKLLMSAHRDLQTENANLLVQLSHQQQKHKREIHDERNANQQKLSELAHVRDRFEHLLTAAENQVQEITANRDHLAAEKVSLTEQVSQLQSDLQAALANTKRLKTAANDFDKRIRNGQLELTRSRARISELEAINIKQMKRLFVLEAKEVPPQSTSSNKAIQPEQAHLRTENKPQENKAQQFSYTDFRYKDKEVQGYTVIPT